WVALERFAARTDLNNRSAPWLTPVVARLRPGVTLRTAQAEMDLVTAGLEQQYPAENRNRGALMVSFDDQYFGHLRPVLFILFGTVAFV
ncbi:hypothetical protein, partial [Salmonella sp. SAL4444]|uniref:hypothetical protein n=1 Tax=Salmonella sp. SAL4444 TaxID=3159899 RepID=UPI0039792701